MVEVTKTVEIVSSRPSRLLLISSIINYYSKLLYEAVKDYDDCV
jgi:hypothetical protein